MGRKVVVLGLVFINGEVKASTKDVLEAATTATTGIVSFCFIWMDGCAKQFYYDGNGWATEFWL